MFLSFYSISWYTYFTYRLQPIFYFWFRTWSVQTCSGFVQYLLYLTVVFHYIALTDTDFACLYSFCLHVYPLSSSNFFILKLSIVLGVRVLFFCIDVTLNMKYYAVKKKRNYLCLWIIIKKVEQYYEKKKLIKIISFTIYCNPMRIFNRTMLLM